MATTARRNPHQQHISRVTGVTDPATLAEIEDMMRADRTALNSLSARQFREIAAESWDAVQATRLMDAAGYTVEQALDPAATGAAILCVQGGVDPPVRPLTFTRGGGGYATYLIPYADWRADLDRGQAARLAGAGPITAEHPGRALCRSCGEVFTARTAGLRHPMSAEHETPCGGRGDLVAGWFR